MPTTEYDMPKSTPGDAGREPSSTSSPQTRPDNPDDEILGAVLIRMWALASGRTLRRDVSTDELSVEELIAFWADDLTPPTGQHAKPGGPDRASGSWNPQPADGRVLRRPRRGKRRRPQGKGASGRQALRADTAVT